ncbi:hypothetical protein GCM10010219_41920 [Streptomyces netropsis]|nr:hypothetical protein GCM10010219_41920 [Streptomyces netropsis]
MPQEQIPDQGVRSRLSTGVDGRLSPLQGCGGGRAATQGWATVLVGRVSGLAPLSESQAHALGLAVDTLAYRLVRTRLDVSRMPLETADLILPLDLWLLRFNV